MEPRPLGGRDADPPVLTTDWVASGARLRWRGRLEGLDPGTERVTLVAIERGTGNERELPLGRTRVADGAVVAERLEASVEWSELEPTLPSDWLDLHVRVEVPGASPLDLELPRPRFAARVRHRLGAGRAQTVRGVGHFGPFYTFKAARLAIHVSTLSPEADAELTRTRRWLRTRRALRRGRPLWVIGETGYKGQDTGLHFFRYVTEHHPEIDARFVIDADSPDRAAVEASGPALLHGSPEHVRAVLLADRLIGSHHPEYLYPVRTNDFKRSVHAVKVFLQHGVMGTKWMANLYGRGRGGFETDCFIVSSPFEKRIIETDFGYPADRVVVAGLSRFDALLRPSEPRQELLIIPTWRDWIRTPQEFVDSEFLTSWLGLLGSASFKAAVAEAGWRPRLILHPNFRQFASAFEGAGVEVIRQGEEPVQDLLRSAAALLTDYSSVAFDFALQRRPVVYFQFDRARFLGREGSHMDLDEVLPGAIAFTPDAVAGLVRAATRGVTPEQFERAVRFFPQMDTGSSARVFDAVLAARPTRRPRFVRAAAGVLASVRRRLRRSRLYAPFVKTVYRVARLAPLQRDRVVFESGLGRRFGDSPRAIYESLLASHPQLRTSWVVRRRPPGLADATETLPRLTVRYFIALARAKYLVTNQSFPHYVRTRRNQVYVQTWHGTPLKRMALDQLEVVGRDRGYLGRATGAASQWSVLVSPNDHTSAAMRSAFGYAGRVLEVGYPRNDVLHGDGAARAAAAVRRAYGLPDDRAIVLFAPTFRDRALGKPGAASPAAGLDLAAWAREFGGEASLLVRRHVLDTAALAVPEAPPGAVIDVTGYPDTQQLLAAADVLVTDYSSVYFDYLNLRRPIVFFAPDLADYRDEVRGFYLDYDTDLPGPIATDAAAARRLIADALRDGRFAGYDLDAFAVKYCLQDDGSAAGRVVAAVFDDLRS